MIEDGEILVEPEPKKVFEPAPKGNWSGVCVDMVDLGLVKSTYEGKTSEKRMVRYTWQISKRMSTGKRYIVTRRYPATLYVDPKSGQPKSNLAKLYKSWFGYVPDNVVMGFGVGEPGMVNVSHSAPKPDGTIYANVETVSPLPEGMDALQPEDYVRVKDRAKEGHHGADEEVPF